MLKSHFRSLLAGMALWVLTAGSGYAATIVTVTPSLGPDYLGSPNYGTFSSNALSALETGSTSAGTPNTPGYFNKVTQIVPKDVMTGVTPSWRGVYNPAAPFDQEVGTILWFGLHISSDQYFSMWGVTYSENAFGVPYGYAFNGDSYDDYAGDMVGIDYVDGIKGNGNDVMYNAGVGSVNVNELIFVGIGFTFDASGYPGTPQQQLNAAAADVPLYEYITGGYFVTVPGGVALDFANVQTVPEPGTVFLSVLGLAGIAMLRRRRSRG